VRILIHGINYAPEPIGVGKYSGEMAEWLAGHGHEIRVVTAPPYYPQWRVSKGYSAWSYERERKGTSSLVVYRCPLWVPAVPSGLRRVVHLISFVISSLPVMLAQIFWRPNAVVVVEPTLFCAPSAWLTARLSGAKAWLHIQDFEMDAAFQLGLLKKGRVGDLAFKAESWMMRRFDQVSAISENMRECLKQKGVEPVRCVLFPNWVDTKLIYPMQASSPMRGELGIPEDKIVALYSGNIAIKQGLEVLVQAARDLSSEHLIQFVLCGEGVARRRLLELSAGLANITWLGLQPLERLNDLLNLADVHLLPQLADVADLVMPSKLTGMLASGRPVVATSDPGTQVGKVVSQCGLVVTPGVVGELVSAIQLLSKDPGKRHRLGGMARKYAVENLDSFRILGEFERVLAFCCEASV
jgi:putative colanic acid biosynthesis glycosyltransferase WcaI